MLSKGSSLFQCTNFTKPNKKQVNFQSKTIFTQNLTNFFNIRTFNRNYSKNNSNFKFPIFSTDGKVHSSSSSFHSTPFTQMLYDKVEIPISFSERELHANNQSKTNQQIKEEKRSGEEWPAKLRLISVLTTTKEYLNRSPNEGIFGENSQEAIDEISDLISHLMDPSNHAISNHFRSLFEPRGILQEISMRNEWSNEYLFLASEYDSLEYLLIDSSSPSFTI